METQMPEKLPLRPEDCRSLKEWIEFGLGISQYEIALLAKTSQGRISLIVTGQMPRRKHWPVLLKALRLEGREALFYRWIIEARALTKQKAELKRPVSETHPLIAAAQVDGEVIRTEGQMQQAEAERRAIG